MVDLHMHILGLDDGASSDGRIDTDGVRQRQAGKIMCGYYSQIIHDYTVRSM